MSQAQPDTDLQDLLAQGARLYASGQTAAAANVYRRAHAIAPEDPTVRLRLAMALWHGENRWQEALAEVRALVRTYPQAPVLVAEATILNSLGRFDEAAGAARRALQADPVSGGAWVELATAIPRQGAAAAAAEATAALPLAADRSTRRQINLALSRLLRKAGDDDGAFAAVAASNADAPRRWDAARERANADFLARVLTPDLMHRMAGEGLADGRMIFIVGMPRSGTTLVERLLSAHPDAATAGETTLIGTLFGQLIQQVGRDPAAVVRALDGPNLRALGAAYLQGIGARVRDTPLRVIDKMPANYQLMPLIRLVFPRAAILRMDRHPLDNCLSCWEAGFSFGQDYAARFDTLGAAYRLYAEIVDRWTALPRLRVQRVRYETLVTDPEPALRRIVETCRLAWDPACLAPAEGGQIKTASIAQARGAISTRSVGRWQIYGDRMGPLIEALGGMDWIDARAAR